MLNKEHLTAVKASLFAGQYNLLLGSGIAMDATSDGANLMSASALTEKLCELKSVGKTTPLSRVSLLLSPEETERHLTKPFSKCKPGETAKRITRFAWKSIYTFNIDDSLEAAYETTIGRKQVVESINFDQNYKIVSNRGQVPIIHLHGYVREAEKGYVFSISEYARVMRGLNPWTHVLSELLASEPFIVAGTSLNESDLEYYLSSRNESSLRSNRGPSLLIEPYPDQITEQLCKRHGFLLVKATFAEFLSWLLQELGSPPSIREITVPSIEGLFTKGYSQERQVEFFSSFELVKPVGENSRGEPSPFMFGKAPRWSDLESRLDLPTQCEGELKKVAEDHLESGQRTLKILCLVGESGAGKTSIIRRVSYDFAKNGRVVLFLTGKVAWDIENTRAALSSIAQPVVLVVDNAADQATSIMTMTKGLITLAPVVILCGDRDYREDHIDRILGDLHISYFRVPEWEAANYVPLIERYRKSGLLAQHDAIQRPNQYAEMLAGDPVAIACCRILNSFRPLESIIRSLWDDSSPEARVSYVIASLAEFCYSGGISYPILQRAQANGGLYDQLNYAVPLPLTYTEDGEYVLPLHAIVGEKLLAYLARHDRKFVLSAFVKLATAIAPYVNRETIIARTPEARLAQRLFVVDQVVRPLLADDSKEFFQQTQSAWQWNSRYWEQRALLTQMEDLDTAIQYARHAVAIEDHPLPLTTLASLVARKMEATRESAYAFFEESFALIRKAVEMEASRGWRPTPHPYAVLFRAIEFLLNIGGRLSSNEESWVRTQAELCIKHFARELSLKEAAYRVVGKLDRR
ncbi:SIR2-like protein [Cupriavidus alkaliphilus]|nr:SIR2-like protein [Cupriavidus alkaliphilus]